MCHLHVDDEDCDVRGHADIHQSPECNVGRKSQIEEEERGFNNPVYEVVVYFLDEKNLEDPELLQPSYGVHVSW